MENGPSHLDLKYSKGSNVDPGAKMSIIEVTAPIQLSGPDWQFVMRFIDEQIMDAQPASTMQQIDCGRLTSKDSEPDPEMIKLNLWSGTRRSAMDLVIDANKQLLGTRATSMLSRGIESGRDDSPLLDLLEVPQCLLHFWVGVHSCLRGSGVFKEVLRPRMEAVVHRQADIWGQITSVANTADEEQAVPLIEMGFGRVRDLEGRLRLPHYYRVDNGRNGRTKRDGQHVFPPGAGI